VFRFLCPVNANVYNIQFLHFKIRDIESNTVLFEITRDPDEESIGSHCTIILDNLPEDQQDEARTVRYQFGP
jgi:hypothetical protein